MEAALGAVEVGLDTAIRLCAGLLSRQMNLSKPKRLRRCHVALNCVFKEFRIRFDVQRLHHPVLVKCHRARLYVDNICDFFHRHPFRQ